MLSSWSKGRRFPIQWCLRSILQSIHDLPSRSGCNTPPLRDSGPLQPQYTRAASLGWMQNHCNKLLGTWRFTTVFEPLRGRTKDLNIDFFHILSRRRLYVQIYGLILPTSRPFNPLHSAFFTHRSEIDLRSWNSNPKDMALLWFMEEISHWRCEPPKNGSEINYL